MRSEIQFEVGLKKGQQWTRVNLAVTETGIELFFRDSKSTHHTTFEDIYSIEDYRSELGTIIGFQVVKTTGETLIFCSEDRSSCKFAIEKGLEKKNNEVDFPNAG